MTNVSERLRIDRPWFELYFSLEKLKKSILCRLYGVCLVSVRHTFRLTPYGVKKKFHPHPNPHPNPDPNKPANTTTLYTIILEQTAKEKKKKEQH